MLKKCKAPSRARHTLTEEIPHVADFTGVEVNYGGSLAVVIKIKIAVASTEWFLFHVKMESSP